MFLTVAALAAGCGGGGGVGPGSGAPVPLAQSPGAWSQVICDQNFKCASKADIGGNNKQGCLTVDQMVWQTLATSVQTEQAKGRVSYDPAAMGACLATLAHESCADWTNGLTHDEWCSESFTPMVNLGGACQTDVECIGGHCDGADLSKTPPVEGTCKPTFAHGAACVSGDACVATDYCEGTAMMCVGKKAGGTACTSDEQCAYDHCNPDTNLCSGYAGCAVAPGGPGSALASAIGFALVAWAARRRRPRPAT
jgi:hypothetical protein